MHILASREAILAAVAPLMAIAQRGLKTNQNLLIVRATAAGTMQLTCSDDNAVMTSQAEVTVKAEGQFAVTAKRLHDIVRSLPASSSIDLQATTTHITIAHGGSRFRVNAMPIPDALQRTGLSTNSGTGKFTYNTAEFGYLLSVAQHAVAEAMSAAVPDSLLVHITGNRLRLIGTNGGRMAVSSTAIEDTQDAKLILSPNTVADLKAIIAKSGGDDDFNFSWANGMIEVSCGGTVYQAGIIDSKFVDYERVVRSTVISPFHIGLAELRGIVSRMMIVSDAVTVKLEGRTLHVTTEVSEGKKKGEECTESMELPDDALNAEGFQVTVNARFLMDAFNAVRGEPVHLSYSSGGPLVILAANGEARVYVMPLRV